MRADHQKAPRSLLSVKSGWEHEAHPGIGHKWIPAHSRSEPLALPPALDLLSCLPERHCMVPSPRNLTAGSLSHRRPTAPHTLDSSCKPHPWQASTGNRYHALPSLLSTSLSVCGHDPEVNVLPFGSQICLSLYCLKNPLFITAGFLPTVYLPAVLAPPLAIVIMIRNPPPPSF